ncbi:MAG TPA: glycosyltransferase [Rhizomicrobium sp.]
MRSLREAGRLTEAETRCRRILDRDPHHPRAAVELGAILRHRQDLAAALLQMESAAEKNPTDVQTQLQLGQVLLALRRHDEAKAKFLIALELGQDKIAAHQGLAKAARAVSDWPQSLHHLEAVAGLTPLDTSVLLDIATVQFEMLLFDDAEATLQRAENHAEGGSSERYLARKFEYFCVTTQWERAAQCLAQWPTHRDVPRVAVADVVRFYAERGHWHDVIDFFRERVIEQGWSGAIQGSEVLLDTLAGAIRHTGRYDEALQLLDRWPDDDSAAAAHNLRDQIAEEVSLLRAIGLLEHDAESQGKPITNPLRAERHALLAGMLARNMSAASKAANTIFYCADAKYLLGATVSLFSLLRHNLAQLKDCTFVVYCSPELLEFASTVFGEIGVFFGTEIEVRSSAALIAEDMAFRTKWGAFTPGRGLSVAAYYRIFAAVQLLEQKGKGRALYIDADTCVGPGMDALLHFDLAGMPIAARREDPLGPAIMRATARLGIEKGEYFNSGVLLFDLANRELEAALRLSIDTALHRQHLLIMVDQCALNIGFNKLSTGLPAEFNYFIRDDNEVVFPEQIPVITHFTAHPKPWDPSYQTRHCMHWFQEFAALGGALEPDRLKRLLAYSFPQGHGAWQGANIRPLTDVLFPAGS